MMAFSDADEDHEGAAAAAPRPPYLSSQAVMTAADSSPAPSRSSLKPRGVHLSILTR